MDDILWPESLRAAGVAAPHIPLMKMDVQGFEMHVLRGAKALLNARAIKTIKTELAGRWLVGQGTSSFELCNFLIANDFDIFQENGAPMFPKECAEWDTVGNEKHTDIIARLKVD
jgi:Methyltransferase FkbM domain